MTNNAPFCLESFDTEPPQTRKFQRLATLAVLVTLSLLAGAFTPGGLYWGWDKYSLPLRVADLVAGVCASVAIVMVRRYPFEVGLFAALIATFSTLGSAANLITLYFVGSRCAPRRAWAVTLVSLAAVPVYSVVYNDAMSPYPASAFLAAGLVLVASSWGMVVRSQRQTVVALRVRAESAQREADLREDLARVDERQKIARDVHDSLAHELSLLSLRANGLAQAERLTTAELAEAAQSVRLGVRECLEELNDVIAVLETPNKQVTDAPSQHDLDLLIGRCRAAGEDVVYTSNTSLNQLDHRVASLTFHFVKDALVIVRRHEGTRPAITLDKTDTGLRVTASAQVVQETPDFDEDAPSLALARRLHAAGIECTHRYCASPHGRVLELCASFANGETPTVDRSQIERSALLAVRFGH